MIDRIVRFMDVKPEANCQLVIGTDSHEKSEAGKTGGQKTRKVISLVTAVTIHRDGAGGRYFWIKQTPKEIHSLREKIYEETSASLRFAEQFVPFLQQHLNGHSPRLEIHIDVGEDGDTRNMIREVVGMVTGSGYSARTKPYSFGASNVADRHT